MPLTKIISGGQAGVDRAALDVALELEIPCGGWCPKGRKAEDGAIDPIYPLKETPSEDYAQRTEWNVRDSDGVLILCDGDPTGGTALAMEFTKQYRKPCLVIDLKTKYRKETFVRWVKRHGIKTLSVGGPRESYNPGLIYAKAKIILKDLFT